MNFETGQIACGFSPKGNVAAMLAQFIGMARSEVMAAIYDFTSALLADELISAVHRGCSVTLLIETDNVKTSRHVLDVLASAGVRIYTDARPGLMHDKFVVIDQTHIATGSYNWTQSAETRNAENVVFLRDCPITASEYADAFVARVSLGLRLSL